MPGLFTLRPRDVLDYVALAAALLTILTRLTQIWGQADAKSTIGSVLMLALLAAFAYLELREVAAGKDVLEFSPPAAVSMILLAVGIASVTSSSRGLLESVLGGAEIFLLMAVSNELWRRSHPGGQPGMDQGTLVAGIVAGLIVGCAWAGTFLSIWGAMILIYFSPRMIRARTWNIRVPVIPFLILAAITARIPSVQDYVIELGNSGPRDQRLVVERFIRNPIDPQMRIDKRLEGRIHDLSQDQNLQVVSTFWGWNPFRDQVVFKDRGGHLLFIVVGEKEHYRVENVVECRCLCAF